MALSPRNLAPPEINMYGPSLWTHLLLRGACRRARRRGYWMVRWSTKNLLILTNRYQAGFFGGSLGKLENLSCSAVYSSSLSTTSLSLSFSLHRQCCSPLLVRRFYRSPSLLMLSANRVLRRLPLSQTTQHATEWRDNGSGTRPNCYRKAKTRAWR